MSTIRERLSQPAIVGGLTGLAFAVLVLGPALAPGFVLHYDMVFVPDLALSPRTLGTDGAVPRAVPNDAVVAALSLVLPGWVVQKFLLLLVFVALGAGIGLILKSVPGTIAATAFACWNPWLAQRLEVGHWGYVLGYAALPWVVWAAQRARHGGLRSYAQLGLVLVFASLTGSTGAVLALIALTGVTLFERPRAWRAWAVGFVTTILISATWWFPFLTAASQHADPEGATAFAAQADTPLGVVGSVMSGGGIWNQAAWYPERQSWFVAMFALVVTVGAVVALYRLASADTGLRGFAVAGIVSLIVATLAALPVGRELLTFFVTNVPGGGLLRDAQKFAAPWVLAGALGIGLAIKALGRHAGAAERRLSSLALGASLVLPIMVLPSLAWGSNGSWQAVKYPADMLAVAEEIEHAEVGSVAVFPWIQYRRYDWNNNRIVLDPWNRLLARDVIINDGLPLKNGRWIGGEDPRAADISALLQTQKYLTPGLRSMGVRHVVLLTDQPNQDVDASRIPGATLRYETAHMQWWDLGAVDAESRDAKTADFTGWIIALIGLIGLGFVGVAATRRHEK